MKTWMRKSITKGNLSHRLLFPVMYPIHAVLGFYFTNHHEASLRGLLFTIAIAFFFLAVSWIFFNLLLNDHKKSALVVFVSAVLFFSFQNIVTVLIHLSILCFDNDLYKFWFSNSGQLVVFCIGIMLITATFFLVKKLNNTNPKLFLYLNMFSIFILFITLINGLISINRENETRSQFERYWENQIDAVDVSVDDSVQQKPDIYYIIVDGFARSDILLDLYNLDNSAFIGALESRGFYIASESYSNYTSTRTSLASSLNMQYLEDVPDLLSENKSVTYPADYMLDNSIVEQLLRLHGYTMVSFKSLASPTRSMDWDIYYQPKFLPDYYSQTFISTTALSVFLNPQLYRWHYNLVNYVIETLPMAATVDGPKFVFAHILCPHPPFVFDPDGNFVSVDRLFTIHDASHFIISGSKEEYRQGYSDQITYLQVMLIKMIDEIIGASDEPFIIILQADHGSGMFFDHEGLANSNVKERLSILNAMYFYDQNFDQLYPQISPVNTFRVIFTNYFNINKPLLEEKHFYTKIRFLFDFIPVGDLLK